MLQLIRSLVAPLASIALTMVSAGYFITFMSVRLKTDGVPASIIGYVHAAYYAGLLLGSWKFEPLLYRIGHIRSFAAAAAISTATILLQGMVLSPYFWILMRFFSGICLASIFIVIESWLLSKSNSSTRGRILSLYMIGLYGSQATGQFLMEVFDTQTLIPFLAASVIFVCSAVPLSLTYSSTPESHPPCMKSFWSLFKASPFGVIGCILAGMILSSIYSFVPIFAKEINLSVSWVTSLTIAGGFLLQWPIGHLSDIFDRRKILLTLGVITLFPSLGLFFFPHIKMLVYSLSFILGGLCFTIYPVSITQVCDRVQPEDITSTTVVLMLAYAVGAVIGPLLAPLLMPILGAKALYVFIAINAGILTALGCWSMLEKPVIAAEDQTEYVSLPRMTTVALELDPRIEMEQEQQTTELR